MRWDLTTPELAFQPDRRAPTRAGIMEGGLTADATAERTELSAALAPSEVRECTAGRRGPLSPTGAVEPLVDRRSSGVGKREPHVSRRPGLGVTTAAPSPPGIQGFPEDPFFLQLSELWSMAAV